MKGSSKLKRKEGRESLGERAWNWRKRANTGRERKKQKRKRNKRRNK